MKYEINILEAPSSVTAADIYSASAYNESGFYIMEDSATTKYLLHVNIANSMVWSMDFTSLQPNLTEIKEPEPVFELDGPAEAKSTLTEEFALKMLAISQGNVNFKDI